jgi:hypothetical protein
LTILHSVALSELSKDRLFQGFGFALALATFVRAFGAASLMSQFQEKLANSQ